MARTPTQWFQEGRPAEYQSGEAPLAKKEARIEQMVKQKFQEEQEGVWPAPMQQMVEQAYEYKELTRGRPESEQSGSKQTRGKEVQGKELEQATREKQLAARQLPHAASCAISGCRWRLR